MTWPHCVISIHVQCKGMNLFAACQCLATQSHNSTSPGKKISCATKAIYKQQVFKNQTNVAGQEGFVFFAVTRAKIFPATLPAARTSEQPSDKQTKRSVRMPQASPKQNSNKKGAENHPKEEVTAGKSREQRALSFLYRFYNVRLPSTLVNGFSRHIRMLLTIPQTATNT